MLVHPRKIRRFTRLFLYRRVLKRDVGVVDEEFRGFARV
jgi:hypothetical protein